LCLESNYGTPGHWARLVEHAREVRATRLVWVWTHPTRGNLVLPPIYRWLPAFHGARDWRAEGVLDCRSDLAAAAEMTHQAGMEFYLWYAVLHFNLSQRERLPQQLPELFNGQDVPDAGRPFFSYFVKEQLREVYRDFPMVDGVVLWMCENSDFDPLRLSQYASSPQAGSTSRLRLVLDGAVDAIRACCREEGRGMVADIHSAGGDLAVTQAMIESYARYPELVVQTDATWGDYSLTCPTSVLIPEIIKHNPLQVNFDCYGEYFGRNFVPTIYLNWIKRHWDNARAMAGDKLVGIDGRVSTAHDNWSPLYEILPRFRPLFPAAPADNHRLKLTKDGKPVYLEISSFETLCTVHPAALQQLHEAGEFEPLSVIREMCAREFGSDTANDLAALLAEVETILVDIFYINKLYFGTQSVLPNPGRGQWVAEAHCFYDLFQEPGSDFPNLQTLADNKTWFRCSYDGPWPAPKGLKTISFSEMSAGLAGAVQRAASLLDRFHTIAARLKPVDATFLDRQFSLLLLTARVRYHLFRCIYYNHRLRKDFEETASRAALAAELPELVQAVDTIEPLLGAEDASVIVPARQWIEEFGRVIKPHNS
jgi:hypothetical protein